MVSTWTDSNMPVNTSSLLEKIIQSTLSKTDTFGTGTKGPS